MEDNLNVAFLDKWPNTVQKSGISRVTFDMAADL